MRKVDVLKSIASSGVLLACVLIFQNCGEGFKSASDDDLARLNSLDSGGIFGVSAASMASVDFSQVNRIDIVTRVSRGNTEDRVQNSIVRGSPGNRTTQEMVNNLNFSTRAEPGERVTVVVLTRRDNTLQWLRGRPNPATVQSDVGQREDLRSLADSISETENNGGTSAPNTRTGFVSWFRSTFAPDNDGPVDHRDGGNPLPANSYLSVEAITSTSVTIKWRATNTTGSDLKRFYRIANGQEVRLLQRTGHSGTFTDSGLQPNTTYQYRMTAFNGISIAQSGRLPVTTSGAQASSPGPVNSPAQNGVVPLRVSSRSATAMTLNWGGLNVNSFPSDINRYNVYMNGQYRATVNKPITYRIFSGLAPNTSYKFYLVPVKADGTIMSRSREITERTNSSSVTPPANSGGSSAPSENTSPSTGTLAGVSATQLYTDPGFSKVLKKMNNNESCRVAAPSGNVDQTGGSEWQLLVSKFNGKRL